MTKRQKQRENIDHDKRSSGADRGLGASGVEMLRPDGQPPRATLPLRAEEMQHVTRAADRRDGKTRRDGEEGGDETAGQGGGGGGWKRHCENSDARRSPKQITLRCPAIVLYSTGLNRETRLRKQHRLCVKQRENRRRRSRNRESAHALLYIMTAHAAHVFGTSAATADNGQPPRSHPGA
ncbi:hypothetical protein LTR28_003571 [Elasticomyces elasticus]|nr:hypothetical protein LTR28_003571 [Elasticomyces elasticus]